MQTSGTDPGSEPPQAGSRRSLLDRLPGARLATVALAIAVVFGLTTLRLWLPTQQEPCFPDEPTLAACRNVAPWALATALLAIPALVTLIWVIVQDRRR